MQMDEAVQARLIATATAAREAAYAPYSKFPVGAALLTPGGEVYSGCNVENAAYGLTMCAERTALFHAVAEGRREFVAVAVVTENGVPPCGACRQALAEFNPQMTIIVADTADNRKVYTLEQLLPSVFGPGDLPQDER